MTSYIEMFGKNTHKALAPKNGYPYPDIYPDIGYPRGYLASETLPRYISACNLVPDIYPLFWRQKRQTWKITLLL